MSPGAPEPPQALERRLERVARMHSSGIAVAGLYACNDAGPSGCNPPRGTFSVAAKAQRHACREGACAMESRVKLLGHPIRRLRTNRRPSRRRALTPS